MTVIYKPGEVMKMLGLKESVFKKYYMSLEKEGYVIQRNPANHRIFTDKDVKTLETFIEMIRYDGMTIESVAKKIGSMERHEGMTENVENRHDVMSLVSVALEERDRKHAEQLKVQEQQFAERMQEVLAQQTARIEKEMEAKFHRLEDPIKRIEEHLMSAAPKKWWKFW